MKGGSRAVGHSGSVDAESLLLQFVHGFAHGGEVVEHILRPDADAHYGAGVSGTVVYGLRQEQQSGHQSFLVHAVARTYIIACGNDTAVL